MAETTRTILVVEDNALVAKQITQRLTSVGYIIKTAENSTSAIKSVHEESPDLMILDLSLVEEDPFSTLLDGMPLLAWLRRTLPTLNFPVIIYTVDDSPRLEATARSAGIYAVCRKADGLDRLVDTVHRVFGEAKAA